MDDLKCLIFVVCELIFIFQLSRYKGGPALPRKLISQGVGPKQYSIEVYPLCLKVTDARDNSVSIVKLSKKVLIDFFSASFLVVSFPVMPMIRKEFWWCIYLYGVCSIWLVFDITIKNDYTNLVCMNVSNLTLLNNVMKEAIFIFCMFIQDHHQD